MKRILLAVVAVLLVGLMVFKLYTNKKEIVEASKPKADSTLIPVTVEMVKKQSINSTFTYIGTFAPNKEVPISAEGQGKIIKVMVKEGDFVKQGQTLALIDNEMLKLKLKAEQAAVETQRMGLTTAQNAVETAQNSLASAKNALVTAQNSKQSAQAILQKAKTDLQRFENLMKDNATSDMNLQNAKMGVTQAENGVNQAEAAIIQAQNGVNQAEMGIKQAQMQVNQAQFGIKQAETQVETTQKMIAQTELKAPISGVVTMKNFDMGSMIGPGTPIGMVTDISTVKLQVMIPEADILKFRERQAATVLTDIYGEKTFPGNVSLVSVKSDNAHSYKVEVSVNNSGSTIKSGMYGRLVSSNGSAAGVTGIYIPRGVLVGNIQEPRVYVVENGKAALRNVVLGAVAGDWIEVKEGLKEGDNLITTGQINLEDGKAVQVAKSVVAAK